MPKIIQLSPHIANLIAAGEVVERPASVVKELLENAVDAGASKITVEIREGGMTFLRVTDNGCGMAVQDARMAFLRHATSKLRTADDLAAIGTMGFRGEALAAIASVSRIDLMTKTAGAVAGTSMRLEGGQVVSESEIGCPEGTTIIIRDLFYNTPARMKFMRSDTVEGSRVSAAVQLQALAHPNVAIQFLRDGKSVLSTPGSGGLQAALYCVYGRECAKMVPVESRWENYGLTGFISLPTDARASRAMQTFFVNNRPVKSKLLVTALEEAYRNQLMVGKFPACVLHLTLPAAAVDVNVHPAKTEVKFLSERSVFDCVHYGCLGALNKQPDRPNLRFAQKAEPVSPKPPQLPPRQEPGTSAKTAAQFQSFATAVKLAPAPRPEAAAATVAMLPKTEPVLKDKVILPAADPLPPKPKAAASASQSPVPPVSQPEQPNRQQEIPMPAAPKWRMVGELYRTYIVVEEGEDAFLIDKHAAHERILFERLKAQPQGISAQSLLSPLSLRLSPSAAGLLLSSTALLEELGFEIEEFGENTLLVRQIPMDLSPEDATEALETLADDLSRGRREGADTVRDELLHTVACKAAIKAGWHSDEKELLAIVQEVMSRQELKYCPHGRPICVSLSKKSLEKQFKRT